MILQKAVISCKLSIKNFYLFSHLMPLVSFYTPWQHEKGSGDTHWQMPVAWNGVIQSTNLNPLRANHTKCSNTLKQFVGNLSTNCLSVWPFCEVGTFFSIWIFFNKHSRFTGQQGKEEGIYLTPLYHFHPLHRHLDIRRAITTETSPLRIASSRNRTGVSTTIKELITRK